MGRKPKKKPYPESGRYNHNEQYYKEHPEEYQQYLKDRAEFLSKAQSNFIKENPERFKEIQRMGNEKISENCKRRRLEIIELGEEYFGKE